MLQTLWDSTRKFNLLTQEGRSVERLHKLYKSKAGADVKPDSLGAIKGLIEDKYGTTGYG
jgi:hypothetical protein